MSTLEQPVHQRLDHITVTDRILTDNEQLQPSAWEELAELLMS